jgi:hypothetical protein
VPACGARALEPAGHRLAQDGPLERQQQASPPEGAGLALARGTIAPCATARVRLRCHPGRRLGIPAMLPRGLTPCAPTSPASSARARIRSPSC